VTFWARSTLDKQECWVLLEAFSAVRNSYLASPTFANEAANLATIKIGLSKIAPNVLRLASSEAKREPDDNSGKNAFPPFHRIRSTAGFRMLSLPSQSPFMTQPE
jgi:hypothetical protein